MPLVHVSPKKVKPGWLRATVREEERVVVVEALLGLLKLVYRPRSGGFLQRESPAWHNGFRETHGCAGNQPIGCGNVHVSRALSAS